MSAALAGCSSKPVEVVETREAMSTIVTVRVAAASDAKAREALKAAWQEMDFGIAGLVMVAAAAFLARRRRG